MENGRIAVSSMEASGLNGQRSGHFGHCDVFTLVDVEGGKIFQKTIKEYTSQNKNNLPGE